MNNLYFSPEVRKCNKDTLCHQVLTILIPSWAIELYRHQTHSKTAVISSEGATLSYSLWIKSGVLRYSLVSWHVRLFFERMCVSTKARKCSPWKLSTTGNQIKITVSGNVGQSLEKKVSVWVVEIIKESRLYFQYFLYFLACPLYFPVVLMFTHLQEQWEKNLVEIFFFIVLQILGVPHGGPTRNKLDFQVAPIALLLGV